MSVTLRPVKNWSRNSAAPQPLGFAACYRRDARIGASSIAFGLHELCSVKLNKQKL